MIWTFFFAGTLSTHAILKGVGVGSDIVNPLSATVTWVNKNKRKFEKTSIKFIILRNSRY